MLIRKLASDQYQLISSNGPEQGTLAELAVHLGDAPVDFIMPAEHCGLRQVEYADHERKLLHKIIPFSLEEEVADRVDDLHFAISVRKTREKQAHNVAGVCYTEKTHLTDALAPFHGQPVNLVACLPELLLLPWQPGQWTLVVRDDGQCLIRNDEFEGLFCHLSNLELALELLGRDKPAPAKVAVYVCGQDSEVPRVLDSVPGLSHAEIEVETVHYWQLLAAGARQQSENKQLNLLTGDYAPQLPWGKWWQQWRVAALLLVAIILADSAGRFVESRRLELLNQALAAETETLFRQVMPGAAMVDPQLQLQRHLDSLQGNGANGFIALLNRAAPVIMNNPELEVQNLNYSEGDQEIRLTLITSDFNSAEAVRTRLESLGLRAELTGSASSANGSRSSLSIGTRG